MAIAHYDRSAEAYWDGVAVASFAEPESPRFPWFGLRIRSAGGSRFPSTVISVFQENIGFMAQEYVKFKNDLGLPEIGVGVKEFKCIGETPPHDHPHIYQAMGDRDFAYCLYCNTKYVFRPYIGRRETEPPGNIFENRRTD